MQDTGRINILKKLAQIADELDIKGFRKEANAVTNVMSKVALIAPILSVPKLFVPSQIEKRKKADQYTYSVADFQNTIDYAVKKKLTIRQMYDYAVENRGGDDEAKRFANNLIAKYRTIYPHPDTVPVKPLKLS
jgi:hypothetical protein